MRYKLTLAQVYSALAYFHSRKIAVETFATDPIKYHDVGVACSEVENEIIILKRQIYPYQNNLLKSDNAASLSRLPHPGKLKRIRSFSDKLQTLSDDAVTF